MSPGKRSDALHALVQELVDLDRETELARDAEGEARRESIAARQVLDSRVEATKRLEDRLEKTREAMAIIQIRDEVSDAVVDALIIRLAK